MLLFPHEIRMEQNVETTTKEEFFDSISFFYFSINRWYFIALSLIICGIGGYLLLRYSDSVYTAKSSIIINVVEEDNPLQNLLEDNYSMRLGRGMANAKAKNSILKLKSEVVTRYALKNSHLLIRYFKEGRIKGMTEVHRSQSPVTVDYDSIHYKEYNKLFTIVPEGDRFKMGAQNDSLNQILQGRVFKWGEWIDDLKLRVSLLHKFKDLQYFRITDLGTAAKRYNGRIDVKLRDQDASVYDISIRHTVDKCAVEFANLLAEAFVKFDKKEKVDGFEEALNFMDARLMELRDTLDRIEEGLTSFKISNKIISSESKGEKLYNDYLTSIENEVDRQNRLEYLQRVVDYVNGKRGIEEITPPVVVGISNPQFVQIISDLKEAYLEKQKKLRSLTPEAPVVEKLNEKIVNLNNLLQEVIETLIDEATLELKAIKERRRQFESQLGLFPIIEQKLMNINRNYSINQGLYSFLLQKRLETSLKRSSLISSHQLLETAERAKKVSPKNLQIYFIALIIGFGIPVGIFLIVFISDSRIRDVHIFTDRLSIPFLGTIPKSKTPGLNILNSPKSLVAESFRSLKTNLRFLNSKESGQVLLVTSSMPGEGKTFTCENLAAILAYGEKKTIVIGADLRKPKLFYDFNLKNRFGLSDYLSGAGNLEEVIIETMVDNLSVILAGASPPNPAELLEGERFKDLLNHLKEKYNYIIIDTPPIDIVADTSIMLPMVDVVLLVARHNFSDVRILDSLNNKYINGRLPKGTGIVLNEFNPEKSRAYGRYGYGYGGSYGYSASKYSFNYGYGYLEESKSEKKGILVRILDLFRIN